MHLFWLEARIAFCDQCKIKNITSKVTCNVHQLYYLFIISATSIQIVPTKLLSTDNILSVKGILIHKNNALNSPSVRLTGSWAYTLNPTEVGSLSVEVSPSWPLPFLRLFACGRWLSSAQGWRNRRPGGPCPPPPA